MIRYFTADNGLTSIVADILPTDSAPAGAIEHATMDGMRAALAPLPAPKASDLDVRIRALELKVQISPADLAAAVDDLAEKA